MGTMLQSYDLTLDDFEQLEGCNEILNVTRPDIVRAIHDAYFDAGVDAVETNSFGTNLSALGEYGIAHRIHELAEASARIARESADAYSTPERQRWVLGSVGPGTKLPTLGHISYAQLRDAYQQEVEGLLAGGIDAVLIETSQDLLQTKAATLGAKRALRVRRTRSSGDRPRDCRDHRHHAARLRDRCSAHLTRAARHRHDRTELCDRPG